LARSMQNPKQIVCKRVLGLEGDEVQVLPSTQLGEGRIVKAGYAAMPYHQVGAAQLYKDALDTGTDLGSQQPLALFLAGSSRSCLVARGQYSELYRLAPLWTSALCADQRPGLPEGEKSFSSGLLRHTWTQLEWSPALGQDFHPGLFSCTALLACMHCRCGHHRKLV